MSAAADPVLDLIYRGGASLPPMSAAADPVLDLIARRRAGGAVREDRARLGLVIEGGGMRGVVGGGMVATLEVLGLRTVFDHVVGASAGACAGAYFLAGQAALGTRIFYEDINNRTFIDLARALRGRPVMNLDFLIDEVMAHAKRLDWPAIRDGGVGFSAVATDADCATTYWCLDKGRCKAKGDNCIATSEDDCKKSTECKTKKRCVLVGEMCGTNPFGDCVDSDLCKKSGYCRTVGELCCKDDGWCCDEAGNCSKR